MDTVTHSLADHLVTSKTLGNHLFHYSNSFKGIPPDEIVKQAFTWAYANLKTVNEFSIHTLGEYTSLKINGSL